MQSPSVADAKSDTSGYSETSIETQSSSHAGADTKIDCDDNYAIIIDTTEFYKPVDYVLNTSIPYNKKRWQMALNEVASCEDNKDKYFFTVHLLHILAESNMKRFQSIKMIWNDIMEQFDLICVINLINIQEILVSTIKARVVRHKINNTWRRNIQSKIILISYMMKLTQEIPKVPWTIIRGCTIWMQ